MSPFASLICFHNANLPASFSKLNAISSSVVSFENVICFSFGFSMIKSYPNASERISALVLAKMNFSMYRSLLLLVVWMIFGNPIPLSIHLLVC